MLRLFAKFKTSRMFPLVYFGVVLLVGVLLVTETKSTPSPKTKVWTLDWSLTIILDLFLWSGFDWCKNNVSLICSFDFNNENHKL